MEAQGHLGRAASEGGADHSSCSIIAKTVGCSELDVFLMHKEMLEVEQSFQRNRATPAQGMHEMDRAMPAGSNPPRTLPAVACYTAVS